MVRPSKIRNATERSSSVRKQRRLASSTNPPLDRLIKLKKIRMEYNLARKSEVESPHANRIFCLTVR